MYIPRLSACSVKTVSLKKARPPPWFVWGLAKRFVLSGEHVQSGVLKPYHKEPYEL